MATMIGIDIGTTSTKVVAFGADGHVLAQAATGYPLLAPAPAQAVQDPSAIVAAVLGGLHTVVAALPVGSVTGLAFSAAMHSLLLLDAAGRPLTPLLTWADNRGAAVAEALKLAPGTAALVARTGVPMHPMSPLVKLRYLAQSDPDLLAQAKHVMGIKSYVLHALFGGDYVSDRSLANASGLFNLHTLAWDAEALRLAGVTAAQLPTLVDTTAQLTGLTSAAVAATGLPAATIGVVGASDGTLANIGVNALAPGVAAVTIGTSGAVRTVIPTPQVEAQGRLFTYYLTANRWVVGGPVNNGGIVLEWAAHTLLSPAATVAEATALAATAPAGAHGLLFFPYLGGERAPLWQADARGSFVGLTREHTKADMMRAVMEGIFFNLASVAHLMAPLVGATTTIQAAGGFAKSPLLRHLLADVFGRAVHIPASVESSALGAAILGMVSLGLATDLDVAETLVGTGATYAPGPDATVYQTLLPLWRRTNAALAPLYPELAAWQNGEAPAAMV